MRVLVLGAGLLGTASAYYLLQQGHEVTVLDRQAHPAAETSHANGGQISVCHAEPWAKPGVLPQILRWIGREDAPLLLRLRADARLWGWAWQFLRECTPSRARRNLQALLRLGSYSRSQLKSLRESTGIEYAQRRCGILHIYTHRSSFLSALGPAEQMRKLGLEREVLSPQEAVRIEPALASIQDRLAGATYTAEDESGDAHRFTVELADRCRAQGVRFLMNHTVTALRPMADRIDHVEATDPEGNYHRFQADAYVLACGSFSAELARPLGLRLPVYPAKGYSATLPVRDNTRAFQVSLIDDEYKLVFSRLGDTLRIAGTAEFSGYGRELNTVRCQAMLKRFETLFPGAADLSEARLWTGLRPSTPSNVPLIGRTRWANLYLNTGHGTLGWTHACGSGSSLARIISGQTPEVEFPFLLA